MPIRSYYRRALVLPLAVPAVGTGLLVLQEEPSALSVALYYLFGSLVLGGVPYLFFATAFLLWSLDRTDGEVRRAILLSPLIYTAILVPSLALFLDGGRGASTDLLSIALFGVGFGYGYVLLAELGRLIFRPGEPTR